LARALLAKTINAVPATGFGVSAAFFSIGLLDGKDKIG
jgi:hypothetical protein